jgi:uncharacterized peroxidase-related enzyme
VLPLVYPDIDPATIIDDIDSADIPELHRVMFRWVQRFTQQSWTMRAEHLEVLRDAGVSDREIVRWAHVAAMQGWWTMSADASGVDLDGGLIRGAVVGRSRESYEAAQEGLTASDRGAGSMLGSSGDGVCWVDINRGGPEQQELETWAVARYGFVPNLLLAVSAAPRLLSRHKLALELIDGPQSDAISVAEHALVRALVSNLNRCAYSMPTTRSLLERHGDDGQWESLVSGADYQWSRREQALLDLAEAVVRNAYKVTEKHAEAFRQAGLDDVAYVEVLNTAAIQTSLDRLANSLGVRPDSQPLIPTTP